MSSRSFLFPVPVTESSISVPESNWLSNTSYVDKNVETNEPQADRPEQSQASQREAELEKYLSDDSSGSISPQLEAISKKAVYHQRKGGERDILVSDTTDSSCSQEVRPSKKAKKSSRNKIVQKKKKHKDTDKGLERKKPKKKRHSDDDDTDPESRHSKKKKKRRSPDDGDSEDSRKYKSHKKKKKKKSKHKEAEKSSFKARYARERYTDFPPVVPGRVFVEDVQGLSSNRPFRTDRQADEYNLAYGGIYSQHLAKRKCLDSLCLGQYGEQRMFLTDKKATEKTSRYYSQSFSSHRKQKGERLGKSVGEGKLLDYISVNSLLGGSSVPKPDLNVNPLGIYDSVTELYLRGKGKCEAGPEHSAVQFENNGTPDETQKMASFNSRLNENPHDIELWLEFVKFQEKAVLIGKSGSTSLGIDSSKPSRKSVLEIKMAVLQKAIDKNPSCLKLKLAQLELGQDLWDSDELLKGWNSLLFHQANNGPLWLKYLEFREMWSSRFSVSGLLKAYQKAVRTLDSVVKGELKSHPPDRDTVWYMLAILKKSCRMLLQAGHSEKTTAVYQALLEYNLFRPEILQNASSEDRKEFFDAFWESSAPRVGDTGALGWSTWIEKKGDVDSVKPWTNRETEESLEDDIIQHTTSTWHTWITMETSRSQRHWLPWRADTESAENGESCEDPDRQILCDDVTSCLVDLTSERDKLVLFCQFLGILGVDTFGYGSSAMLHMTDAKFSTDVFSGSSLKVSRICEQTANMFTKDSCCMEEFVCNLFNQVLTRFSSDYRFLLSKMFMKYKVDRCKIKGGAAKEVKLVKKWIKSVLKEEENRTSIALWEEYARFEGEFVSRDDAFKVLSVTIASQADSVLTGRNLAKRTALCRVFRACAELQLGMKSLWLADGFEVVADTTKDSVLSVLCSLATGETFDVTRKLSVSKTLKTKRVFEEFLDKLLDEEEREQFSDEDLLRMKTFGSLLTHWCTCSAYFLYVTEGLEAAEGMFHKVLDSLRVKVKRPQLECMFDPAVQYTYLQYTDTYKSYISLCKYHTDTTASPLRALRQPLLTALEELPTEPSLLTLYVELESHASISGKVRQYFRTVAPQEDSVIVWLFAIFAEFTRKKKLEEYEAAHEIISSSTSGVAKETGVTHQLRAWFERAVNHSSARQSVLLWRLYANFEVSQGRVDQAKAVFYRALQHCPGEKPLYMDMVRCLPGQLAEITDLMIERELRLRTPLEEVEILREPAQETDEQEVQNIREPGEEVHGQAVGNFREPGQEVDRQEGDNFREPKQGVDGQEVKNFRDPGQVVDGQEVESIREPGQEVDGQEVENIREPGQEVDG